MTDAGYGAVIKMAMGHLKILGQPLLVDRVTMVLGSDQNSAGSKILHRLISPAMSKFQFECLGAECQ